MNKPIDPNGLFTMVTVDIDGEPRASTEVIAQGVEQQHPSAMKLIKKHLAAFESFGLVRFEIRPRLKGRHGGGNVEFAMLNEHQAALLISFMRNTPKVIDFKVSLIREFFRMSEALQRRDMGLWQQMQALIAREVESKVRASFGSRLMLERKREKPRFDQERRRLESQIQPSLLN
jgi:phage regulator Rha-like protein